MAVPTGTFQTHSQIGIREELSDTVHDISPTDRPFMSNISRTSVKNTFVEWQTDSLAAANGNNAMVDGDDASTNTASPTTRFGNYTQTFVKVPRVSGPARAVDTAGRADEMDYQTAKRARELLRDIETRFLLNSATDASATAGSASTARRTAGAGTWLFGNQVANNSSATTPVVSSGAPTSDGTAGTAATFIESQLQTVLQNIWTDGGETDVIVMNAFNKRLFSAFAGVATLYRDTQGNQPASILGAADMYVSDWGTVQAVADRFCPTDTVYAFDLEYWEAGYLRPVTRETLAKTGDSDRMMLLTDVALVCKEPNASGKIFSTTTS